MDYDLAIGLCANGWSVRREAWPQGKFVVLTHAEAEGADAQLINEEGKLSDFELTEEDLAADDWKAAAWIGGE